MGYAESTYKYQRIGAVALSPSAVEHAMIKTGYKPPVLHVSRHLQYVAYEVATRFGNGNLLTIHVEDDIEPYEWWVEYQNANYGSEGV